MALAALLWALGLSTDAAQRLLCQLGLEPSAMTPCGDVLPLLGEVKGRLPRRQVRCLERDGFWAKTRGRGLVVEMEVDEPDPKAL